MIVDFFSVLLANYCDSFLGRLHRTFLSLMGGHLRALFFLAFAVPSQ